MENTSKFRQISHCVLSLIVIFLVFSSFPTFGQTITSQSGATTDIKFVGAFLDPAIFRNLQIQSDVTGQFVQIDDMRYRVDGLRSFGYTGDYWYARTLVYELDPEVSNNPIRKKQFENACDSLARISALGCVERSLARRHDPSYVYVTNSEANFSYVGETGRKQLMGIYNWNSKGIIMHEIMHALGWEHEHSRPDRDRYVIIHKENIDPDALDNFKIARNASTRTGYDFESIMHYGKTAFSHNGMNTIEPLPKYKDMESIMGQKQNLSQTDKQELISHYGEPSDQWCGRIKGPPNSVPEGCIWSCNGSYWCLSGNCGNIYPRCDMGL